MIPFCFLPPFAGEASSSSSSSRTSPLYSYFLKQCGFGDSWDISSTSFYLNKLFAWCQVCLFEFIQPLCESYRSMVYFPRMPASRRPKKLWGWSQKNSNGMGLNFKDPVLSWLGLEITENFLAMLQGMSNGRLLKHIMTKHLVAYLTTFLLVLFWGIVVSSEDLEVAFQLNYSLRCLFIGWRYPVSKNWVPKRRLR